MLQEYMRDLGISEDIIESYTETGTIYVSSPEFTGWEPANEEQLKRSEIAETRIDGKVVCIIVTYFKRYDMTFESHVMYVPGESEEDLQLGLAFAYVFNLDYPDLSEGGSIAVESENGVLKRRVTNSRSISW